jgi:site-specific recombinase XerD
MMLDELQRRNYSQSTARTYIHAVEDFAKYFHRSPERLGPEHIRQYQAYLFRERKLSPGTIEGRTAALRFLFIKTLCRPYLPDRIPFPKRQRRLPTILDQQEVARLIDSAEPDASHHDDDAVCNGPAPSRDVPPQGLRYRQQAHGHSCAPGQGRP